MIHISGHRCDNVSDTGFKDTKNYLSVNCCGYEKYIVKNVKQLRQHGRLDYQLLYMVKGCGYFKIDGKLVEVSCGNIVIFHPEETQQYEYNCKDAPELFWVHFTGYGAHEFLRKIRLLEGQIHYIGIHNVCIEHFKRIMLELQLKTPLYEQVADAVLVELLASIGRKKLDLESQGSKIVNNEIQNIMEQMHSQYNNKWNIADLARQCKLSPNRFMHKFKLQTGFSVMEYLIKIRIDKAKDLLINSSLRVNEISDVIGYDNPLYFSRLFSKAEGMSPREYRKSQKGTVLD